MGKINLHNYEAYLLDFSEGNLTDELQMKLELFLIQHPELDINLSTLDLVSLNEESISFSNKNNLRKTETDLVSEDQFVAYIEGQLSAAEKTEIEKSCYKNPLLSKELALFQKTILAVDSSIIYPNKNELKRKPKVVWFNFSTIQYAAAACVLFLIGLFILWPKEQANHHSNLATNSNNTAKQNITVKTQNPIAPIKEQSSNTLTKDNIEPVQKSNSIIIKSKNIDPKTTTVLLANTYPNNIPKKDSLVDLLNLQNPNNNEALLTFNDSTPIKKANNTIVEVISENDDEPIAPNTKKKKKGIWAAASKALKNLNHAGVKSVNGDEKEESSYALTLGGLSITHKAGL